MCFSVLAPSWEPWDDMLGGCEDVDYGVGVDVDVLGPSSCVVWKLMGVLRTISSGP